MSNSAHSSERFIRLGLLALAIYVYGFWLTGGQFDFLGRPGGRLDLTFNSMLEHMLHGRFDVDASIVGPEGFLRDGRVFAYWGPFFAFIRLPLLLIPGGAWADVTCLSCFFAVCIAACVKLQTLRLAYLHSPPSALRDQLYWILLLVILFAGPQIEFLTPSIYQEVCLWAGAMAATFVYLALRGLLSGRFTTATLCAMAALAGIALLSRVSTGIGLSVALCALLSVTALRERSPRRLLLPLLILGALAATAGLVNTLRWGNPLVFANYRYYLYNNDFPDRWPRTVSYGLFNLQRVPFGIVYYFFPIWVLQGDDGHLLLEATQRRLLDSTELPPASFLLTDPLLLLLMAYALWSLIRADRVVQPDRLQSAAVAAGLAVPCLLMLSAISMCFRYRVEFYPLIEFGAFLGFVLLCRRPPAAAQRRRAWVVVPAAGAVIGSNLTLVLYKISWLGPPIRYLRSGVGVFYRLEFERHYPRLAEWLFH